MKKVIAAVLLAMMLVSLTACGAAETTIGTAMVAKMSGENAGEKDGKTQADVTTCTVELDADGKIVSVHWDVVQCKATVNGKGEVALASDIQTKRELKDAYNMKGASPIGKEWYEQIAALEEYAVGKTVSEVTGMKMDEKTHPQVEELMSSCTMAVGDFMASLTKAAANAQ